MSHLPLDARAILHYLNELGYRNISAEQLKEFLKDLRKLIKYEERMGVNIHKDDYYESLFRKTTASFRAKVDKENVSKRPETKLRANEDNIATTSKQTQMRQRILQERNRQRDDTTASDTSLEIRPPKPAHKQSQKHENSHDANNTSLKSIVEDMVAQILQEKLLNSRGKIAKKGLLADGQGIAFMDAAAMKSVVQDLVNKILKEKLSEQRDSLQALSSDKPLKSIIEDIVNRKLRELHFNSPKTSAFGQNNNNLNRELKEKLNISKKGTHSANSSKTLDSQALMAELLAKDGSKSQSEEASLTKRHSTKTRCQTTEWEQLDREKGDTGIKRLPRSRGKAPEWQETDDKKKCRATSALRSRSPNALSSGRSSRSHTAKGGGSVLIRRSASQGRSRKPNNSDPVALYQYYKKEWDYFRKQIPGETNHDRLRWHVRQRLLDPE